MTSDNDGELLSLRRMDVVQTGRRRRWSDEEKLRILAEADDRSVSLKSVARRHDVAPGQIYTWRRLFGGQAPALRSDGFAAVMVSPEGAALSGPGCMEIRCNNGRRIIVGRDVDVQVLAQVVAALEQ